MEKIKSSMFFASKNEVKISSMFENNLKTINALFSDILKNETIIKPFINQSIGSIVADNKNAVIINNIPRVFEANNFVKKVLSLPFDITKETMVEKIEEYNTKYPENTIEKQLTAQTFPSKELQLNGTITFTPKFSAICKKTKLSTDNCSIKLPSSLLQTDNRNAANYILPEIEGKSYELIVKAITKDKKFVGSFISVGGEIVENVQENVQQEIEVEINS